MPGFYPVVASTASEAQEKYDYLQSLIQKPVGISILEHTIGVHGSTRYRSTGRCRRWPTPTDRSAASACCSSRRDATSSPSGSSVSPMPVRAAMRCRSARPPRWPTRWSIGSRTAPRTASTSCGLTAGMAQGFRRSRHPRAAAPGPLQHGVRSQDLARQSRLAQTRSIATISRASPALRSD